MKIEKNASGSKSVKGSETVKVGKYDEAVEYIQCAISELSKSAKKSDVLARESIANLSVVLMDLK